LGIPELWCYAEDKLRIYLLHNGRYVESQVSPTFLTILIFPRVVERFLWWKAKGRREQLATSGFETFVLSSSMLVALIKAAIAPDRASIRQADSIPKCHSIPEEYRGSGKK